VTASGFKFKVIKFGPIEQDRVYREIGRFIFEFSQLEYTLRHHVADMARIDDQYFDIVTSAFDFAKLCSGSAWCTVSGSSAPATTAPSTRRATP